MPRHFSRSLYLATTLICFSSALHAEHTWVGGNADNDLTHPLNWFPHGINNTAVFNSTKHAARLPAGKEVELEALKFTTPNVVFHIDNSSLLLGSGVTGGALNYSNGNATVRVSNGGFLNFVGGTLADEGKITYQLHNGRLLVSSLAEGQIDKGLAVVEMDKGGRLEVETTSTFHAISSASKKDRISFAHPVGLTLGNEENQIIRGVFEGNGPLVKQGQGKITLEGDNSSYTGPITLKEGALSVNGTVVSTVDVLPGTLLKGSGNIKNLVSMRGGTLSPGNSIGTITLGSLNYLDATSTTQFEISPTNSSSTVVQGNAQLAGHVQVIQEPGRYPLTSEYQILSAQEVTGAFNPQVLGGLPGFQLSLQTNPNSVYLILDRQPLPTTGLSGNTLTIANYLNQVPNLASDVYSSLFALPTQDLSSALNSISPARDAFGTFASQNTMFTLAKLLSSHLNDERFLHYGVDENAQYAMLLADASGSPKPISKGSPQNSCAVWLGAFGEYAHEKAEDQNPAFNFISEGALFGFDSKHFSHTIFGAAIGYAHTHINEDRDAGNANINYYIGTIYSTFNFSKFYLDLAVLGSWNEVENKRIVSFPGFNATAKAKIPGWQLSPHLGLGYEIDSGWGRIQPYATVDWALSWERKFKEEGAGDFDMDVNAHESSMLRSEIGVNLSEAWGFSWGSILLSEKVGYLNKKPFKTGTLTAAMVGISDTFTVESLNSDQNLASVGLELFVRPKSAWPKFSLIYEGEFGKIYQSQELFLKLIKEF